MFRSIHSSYYQHLCRMLVEERKGRGLTQVEVAQRLKQPQSYVSKYESGERKVSIIDLIEIARAIGFDPGKFVRRLDVQIREDKTLRWPRGKQG